MALDGLDFDVLVVLSLISCLPTPEIRVIVVVTP